MSDSYAPALPGIGIRIESEATPPLLEWFAVQTRPRFEKKVVAQLVFKSIGVYLPVRTESHTWSDRRKSVTIPLFPGYAFVHVSPSRQAWQPVLQTAGLLGFVNFGGIVMAVPAKQITDLQLLLQQKVSYSLHPFAQAHAPPRGRHGGTGLGPAIPQQLLPILGA